MREQSLRGVCTVALAALLLGPAASAFGQSMALPPPGAGDQVQPTGGPVRQLSVNDAVQAALEQNLGLRVQRLEPEIADLTIAQVRGSWMPVLNSTVTNSSNTSPVGSFLSGARDKLNNDSVRANLGASQLLPWGTNYTVGWNNSRGKSNSTFDSPNPSLASNISFSFTQPLARNFRIDGTRQQFELSKLTRETTDVSLRQSILVLQRRVRHAYWNLAYATAALDVGAEARVLAELQRMGIEVTEFSQLREMAPCG